MIVKVDSYGPCENLHIDEDIPPATHEVTKTWQTVGASMLVCIDCADRYETQGWESTPLRSAEEDQPYAEEWRAIYGSLPREVDTSSYNPFE